MASSDGIQRAGDVIIEHIKLVNTENVIYDLSEFIAEINIFEDMFTTFLQGNMVLSDSLNLIEKANIIGEELLILKIKTPTFDSFIQKTFRIYKVTDRNIVKDNNTQTFVLHFASVELFFDVLLPLFLPFEGEVHKVAGDIYDDFIAVNRRFEIDQSSTSIKEIEQVTPMVVLNETSNKVKFVSPGWTPFRCITWLASKAIPKETTAKNYLFFESSKAFYFGSIEYILKEAYENKLIIGTYSTSASNIRDGANSPNLNREYFIIKDIAVTDTTDHIKNYTNGYLTNRLFALDVYNKTYEVVDYDYVKEYEKQYHTSGPGSKAKSIFTPDSLRNPNTNISYYPVNPKLFDNFPDNISEKMKDIYGNRKSSLLDITNLRMNITVPGRTDVQIGRVLYLSFPSLEAKDASDSAIQKEDKLYSGYYLITAIRHKINKNEHVMVMEIVKDSLTLQTGDLQTNTGATNAENI